MPPPMHQWNCQARFVANRMIHIKNNLSVIQPGRWGQAPTLQLEICDMSAVGRGFTPAAGVKCGEFGVFRYIVTGMDHGIKQAPLAGESRSGALTGLSHGGVYLPVLSLPEGERHIQSNRVEEKQKISLPMEKLSAILMGREYNNGRCFL